MWKLLLLLVLCGIAVAKNIDTKDNWTNGLDIESQTAESSQNKTFVVVSRIGAPFLSLKTPENGKTLEGNDKYEGYSMDLMKAISKLLLFNFQFEIVPDNKYGSMDRNTREWDGIIRHIMDRKADFGICDLTITSERAAVVDFSAPFMSVGISILFTKPKIYPSYFFTFLSNLSLDIWLYMAFGYIGVSILIYILSRTPPHPISEHSTKGVACRIICVMWAFFALIMLIFYTCYLCSVLSTDKDTSQINSAEDLVLQNRIQYGCVEGGSTMKFFETSETETYRRMYFAMMSAKPSVFTSSNAEGSNRVSKSQGKYAFLMENTVIDYITERDCELEEVGRALDSKGYGIAMPLNSPYRVSFNGAVLKLTEDGTIQQIKDKWWKADHCVKDVVTDASPDSDYVTWFFAFLGGGCFVALIAAVIEYLVRMLQSK